MFSVPNPGTACLGELPIGGVKITVIIRLQTPRDNVNRLYVPEPLRNQHDTSQVDRVHPTARRLVHSSYKRQAVSAYVVCQSFAYLTA